ncbi:Flagellar hook-associated protein FlgK [Candidatus Syntrophocurvum alkaliphilum]|uniref:Flagellar hook-associated protein 1 n=1 Tax=Candidatus Syntrophocurvum alkaliphilum TaxID=2293317 RepID=A0A6I6DHL6_9FIRM|nr:flagellar hook-associated protein FlgK [Candidatus Syntrophocurvum alkaliphilum]QGU00434.1 Flagellar hook-associated protein FlgK [Candidatus Syntrophocurvum alkaliphilum]
MSNFMSLEIGKRSIMTHQTALSVTGHNVSNANTPGYSRQVANITTNRPWHAPMLAGNAPAGQIGTGVKVEDIQRMRDAFLDYQIRNENKTAGYWDSVQQNLSRVEVILNEPSEEGLRAVMDMFWESWQDLSVNPESESVRAVVAELGETVADAFNNTHRQLFELKEDVNSNVKIKIDEINSLADQITDLNEQIQGISIAGKQPNDLLDKRDMLLEELSQITDINVYEEPHYENGGQTQSYSGMVTVQIGGRTLVQGHNYTPLSTKQDENGMHMPVWSDTGAKANINGGELRGLLDSRGKTDLEQDANSNYKGIIQEMIDDLNKLAKTVIIGTNDVHRGGYSLNNKSGTPDGTNFFKMPKNPDDIENWAQLMSLDTTIKNDSNNIAAASNRTWEDGEKVNFGDGSNALKIAQLKQHMKTDKNAFKTGEFEGNNFPKEIGGEMLVNIQGIEDLIKIEIPEQEIKDLNELATAIQQQLDNNETLRNEDIKINVRLDGNTIIFESPNSRFHGVEDGENDDGLLANFDTDDIKAVLNSNYTVFASETDLEFGENIDGALTFQFDGEEDETISININEDDFDDINDLVVAIQEKLDEDEINVNVRADGDTLLFYSQDPDFKGVIDGDGDEDGNDFLFGDDEPVEINQVQITNINENLIKNATTDDFWRSVAANVGVKSQEAKRMVTNQEQLLGELENKRQSYSGVSLDEEMTNMIKYQHAYNAASRYITTIDEAIETIVNRMGLVGR